LHIPAFHPRNSDRGILGIQGILEYFKIPGILDLCNRNSGILEYSRIPEFLKS